MVKYIIYFILLTSFIAVGCSKVEKHNTEADHKHSEIYYTCSMHPQVREDKPGKCPICHMNLTRVEVSNENNMQVSEAKTKKKLWVCENYPDVTSTKEQLCPIDGTPMIIQLSTVGKVVLNPSQMNHFKPAYFTVEHMTLLKKVRLLGSVFQSEEKESNIPARVPGRVEKVYVSSTGSLVNINDPVIDLFSPKLITAGEEYLIAKRSFTKTKSKEFKDMLKQSEERLKQWGIKEFQFEAWEKAGKVPEKITLYSKVTGIVRKRLATIGRYFKEGENFFELSDLSDVWVEMDVYEVDSALIKLGQKVELEFSALPGRVIVGEIDFISPIINSESRTLKIRTTIKNESGKLKPGMIANANLTIELEGNPLVVPRASVIDTGKRKIVWIRNTDNSFSAKEIQSGYESQGYIEVKAGLQAGDEVVVDGNFLVDAQAQLFGGYNK